MLTLTGCHNAPPHPTDAEIAELARRLERGIETADDPVRFTFGSRDAEVVLAVMGRGVGR